MLRLFHNNKIDYRKLRFGKQVRFLTADTIISRQLAYFKNGPLNLKLQKSTIQPKSMNVMIFEKLPSQKHPVFLLDLQFSDPDFLDSPADQFEQNFEKKYKSFQKIL